MASQEFSNSVYSDQVQLEERELSAFIDAVADLFGPEQARLSGEDWLDEAELMDSPPRSTSRDWRSVTVAASARLANRLTVVARDRALPVLPNDTSAFPMPSASRSTSRLLL